MEKENGNRLLNRREVEEKYGIPKRYLERAGADGPATVRFSRYVRYRVRDIEAWLAAHLHGGGDR